MGLFNKKRDNLVKEYLEQDAIIIDVRSASEFRSGHINGSVNIPLDAINHKVKKIKQLNKPVILYCASGIRSASAVSILKRQNIENIVNGGSISSLNRLMN